MADEQVIIVGNDISDNNGQVDWNRYTPNANFVLLKATEGTAYIDKWFGFNRTQSRLHNILRGYYHFARPDLGNSPETEAQFFINVLKGDTLQAGEVVALDFEVNYAGDCVAWCKTFLDTVSQAFNGIKPLIYLNQALIHSHNWQAVVDAGYGLWIANYTYDPKIFTGFLGPWKFPAINQWTDKQSVPGVQTMLDGDCFFGTAEQFRKYGFLPVQPHPTPPMPTPTPEPLLQRIKEEAFNADPNDAKVQKIQQLFS